jgi:glycolate oxidase FAD binding subunit
MRDLVLGVTVVLGDGLVASSGGKVVKNVAGYDLGKLFCGSRGTLGVICRASLRLHPLPEASATVVAPVSSPQDGDAKRQAILRSTLVPIALDVTDTRLAVLFEGGKRAVESQLEVARALVGGDRASDDVWEEVRSRPRMVHQPDAALAALHERIRAELAAVL